MSDHEEERGMSLIELVVAMGIGTVVVFLAVAVLVNTFRSQATVTASTQAATQGQNVSEIIDQAVRTAAAIHVSPDATELDLRTGAGGCEAFAVVTTAGGTDVRHTSWSAAQSKPASTGWSVLAGTVSRIGTTPYFTSQGAGVAYGLRLQAADGGVDLRSSVAPRAAGGGGGTCF